MATVEPLTEPERKAVILPGGAGYLGRALSEFFAAQVCPVAVLSRTAHERHGLIRYLPWDGATPGDWAAALEGASAVINLAGRSVNCRYNAANKQEIYDSRLHSTRAIGQAIARCAVPPPVWINLSSATIYRHALDRPMDEASGEIGEGFSVDVCRKWEAELARAETPRTRKVALRSAIVFGKGGPTDIFFKLARCGLGGTQGRGNQYVSWVQVADFTRAVQWIIDHEELEGPVNCAAPNPLPNRDFMRLVRETSGHRFGLPATAWMLEIGALALGTETELLLKSRRVISGKLRESGFEFRYPELRPALEEILHG